MTDYPTISTRVIGQTEKSLNAILARQLAGTGLTEPQWVILTLAITGGGTAQRDLFTRQVADVLKISEDGVEPRIAELVAARHLLADGDGGTLAVTESARQLHARLRTAIAGITQRLWSDLPVEDLATAGRVLTIINERATAELTR